MSGRERGFAMVTVLVILSAVSMLTFALVERASMSRQMGSAVSRAALRQEVLTAAVMARVDGGLSAGMDGVCSAGICGRSVSGGARSWNSADVWEYGLSGTGSEVCDPVVVTEFLGSSGAQSFWTLAAACAEEGEVVLAQVRVDGTGRRVEWVSR